MSPNIDLSSSSNFSKFGAAIANSSMDHPSSISLSTNVSWTPAVLDTCSSKHLMQWSHSRSHQRLDSDEMWKTWILESNCGVQPKKDFILKNGHDKPAWNPNWHLYKIRKPLPTAWHASNSTQRGPQWSCKTVFFAHGAWWLEPIIEERNHGPVNRNTMWDMSLEAKATELGFHSTHMNAWRLDVIMQRRFISQQKAATVKLHSNATPRIGTIQNANWSTLWVSSPWFHILMDGYCQFNHERKRNYQVPKNMEGNQKTTHRAPCSLFIGRGINAWDQC